MADRAYRVWSPSKGMYTRILGRREDAVAMASVLNQACLATGKEQDWTVEFSELEWRADDVEVGNAREAHGEGEQ